MTVTETVAGPVASGVPRQLAAEMPSLVQSVDWGAVAPPTVTAALALVLLVADLFLDRRRRPLLGWLAVAGLAVAPLTLLPLRGGTSRTFCLTGAPAHCSYVADTLTLVVQALVLGGALLTALLSLGVVRREGLPAGEYWFLLLASTTGALLLPAARDLITLVVALEVVSLPAFALVALRPGDRLAPESALKFFLSSVTATAVTLLGVSFLYGTTGAVHLGLVAEGLAAVDGGRLDTLAATGVLLTLVGFAFKTAAVPFHFWVPETYVGAPVPVAGYLSVVSKAAGLTGLVLLTLLAFPDEHHLWAPVLAVLAALTMTVGNTAALRQHPTAERAAVRLLAWSSIGQAGYLLVPLAAAGHTGRPGEAVGVALAYLVMYAVVNLGAFGVVVLVAGATGGGTRLDDHRGLGVTRPAAGLALAFFLLCLAGLPPGVIGLFAKVSVFGAAVDAGLGWLAVVMAVNVVIALAYYLRWAALLFRRAPGVGRATVPTGTGPGDDGDRRADPRAGRRPTPVPTADGALTVAIVLAAVAALVLSVAPELVLHLVDHRVL